MKMFKVLLILSLLFSLCSSSWAEEISSIGGMDLSQVKLKKEDFLKIIDLFSKTGQISKEEAEKAKKEIAGMSDGELSNLQQKSFKQLTSGNLDGLLKGEKEKMGGESKKEDSRLPAQYKQKESEEHKEERKEEHKEEKKDESKSSPGFDLNKIMQYSK